MVVKGVTFDWWGTIAVVPSPQDDAAIRDVRISRLVAALRDDGIVIDRSTLSKAYDRQAERLEDAWARHRELSPEDQVDLLLRLAGIDRRDPAIVGLVSEALGGAILVRPPNFFPHVRETLDALRARGFAIGLISDTGRSWGRYLTKLQQAVGIGPQFDVRVYSDELRTRKPDPRMFEAALTGLRLMADEVVHIGDDVIADIAVAKEVGMRAIWFNTGFWPGATTDRRDVNARDMERIRAVVDPIRDRASIPDPFRMKSENDFPSNIGLGASASGFAALATAAVHAAGLRLTDEEISRFARRGAGSATRSVTGGFSKWKMGLTDEDSYSVQLARVDLRMAMIVALVPAFKQTDDAHREALTSPFFHARLAEMPRLIAEMELAIRRRAIGEICVLAERDTLMLHGITMTGTGEMVLWQPDTLRVILAVRRLREAGVPAFFSIDTGATVYVNTLPDRADEVPKAIEEPGRGTMSCTVDGPACAGFAGLPPAEIDQVPAAVGASRRVKG